MTGLVPMLTTEHAVVQPAFDTRTLGVAALRTVGTATQRYSSPPPRLAPMWATSNRSGDRNPAIPAVPFTGGVHRSPSLVVVKLLDATFVHSLEFAVGGRDGHV